LRVAACLALGAAALVGPAASAMADDVIIAAAYGDEPGCRFALSGDFDGTELLMLTPKEVSTSVTTCSIIDPKQAGDGNIVSMVLCGHEGEEFQTLDIMRFRHDAERDVFTIFTRDGTSWGEIGRCPP
jgi:hypothetical protein